MYSNANKHVVGRKLSLCSFIIKRLVSSTIFFLKCPRKTQILRAHLVNAVEFFSSEGKVEDTSKFDNNVNAETRIKIKISTPLLRQGNPLNEINVPPPGFSADL